MAEPITSNSCHFAQFSTFDGAYKFLIKTVLDAGEDLPEQGCREVFGVAYQIDKPLIRQELLKATGVPIDWIEEELKERISGKPINPGTAWQRWSDFFRPRLRADKFTYTYAERMHYQLDALVSRLKSNPTTRRAILSVWDPRADSRSKLEVPCTVMSQYAVRRGCLNSVYYTRSSDCINFLVADVYLYVGVQTWIADQVGFELGSFSHVIGSLHIYYDDLDEVSTLLGQLEGEL